MSTGGIQLRCTACSAPVPRPGDRRNLASASSEHVVSELRQLVGRFLPATAIYASNDSYTCRPYFSRIEKILKLRKTTEDIEQEVMVNLKHAAYLYGRQRCRTRRYAQVRELRVDDRGSRCIGNRLQRAARRTCAFLLLSDMATLKDSLTANTCSSNLIGLPTFRQRTQKTWRVTRPYIRGCAIVVTRRLVSGFETSVSTALQLTS